MGKLFFFGDSITAGAWDKSGGWANRLIGRIMDDVIVADITKNEFYCLPYNLGVSGDSVPDILDRFKTELSVRLDLEDPDQATQIVFSIGINDSQYFVNEGRPRFTENEFRENLQKLIDLAKQFGQSVSFTGLTPVDDDLLYPMPWAPEKAYISERVRKFETAIEELCNKNNLPFLPLYNTWTEMPDYKSYLIDGVHPNTKGHILLAQQIGDFIITDEFKSFHSS